MLEHDTKLLLEVDEEGVAAGGGCQRAMAIRSRASRGYAGAPQSQVATMAGDVAVQSGHATAEAITCWHAGDDVANRRDVVTTW